MSSIKYKVHSLTGRIDLKLLKRAFKNVKRNRGVAGYDKVSIQFFEENLDSNLVNLMKRLKKKGNYNCAPLKRVYLPKGEGKLRAIAIPTVRDRVAQEVIRLLLEPIFDPQFSECSYGFRPNRNAHQAIERILELSKQGYKYVVEADIENCFDEMPQELIIDLVAERVADGNILLLIRKFLTAEIAENGKFIKSTQGTPQGEVIAPLLANIVLDVLDKRLTQAGYQLVRYADDFVILSRSRNEAEQALASAKKILKSALGLRLAQAKTGLTTFGKGFNFLGFQISSRGVSVRLKSVEKFKKKIIELTKRSYNCEDKTIENINRVINGFANYFSTSFSTVNKQFYSLDYWIRRRLRCLKSKRISKLDNRLIRNQTLFVMGLISLYCQLG